MLISNIENAVLRQVGGAKGSNGKGSDMLMVLLVRFPFGVLLILQLKMDIPRGQIGFFKWYSLLQQLQ